MIMKKADSLAYMPYNIILFQTLKYGGEPVSVLVGGGGGYQLQSRLERGAWEAPNW